MRGHRLRTTKGRTTRPTSDRVREALFNILGGRVIDSRFLDLFAGSGAVGLEALSRGAREAVFIENNRQALACLHANLVAVGFQDQGRIMPVDARRALVDLAARDCIFDLVYIDPPYRQGWGAIVLPMAAAVLAPAGLAILETAAAEAGSPPAAMIMKARRVYGDTALNFYTRAGGLAGWSL
jgi:16S rRNA (guanine(966)-N(2))-methyltransferase RsmD